MAESTARLLQQDPIAHYPAATVACFDPTRGSLPRRHLDQQRTVFFLEQLAALQVPAVLIAASTGHGHLRTVEELAEWFRCAAAASLRSTVRMALLRPEDGMAANERLIGLLAELKFPVAFVRPGTDLAATASDAAVASSMQPLIAAIASAGLAAGVYSIPDVSGLRLTAGAAARLVQQDGGQAIVAAKVTEADYETSTLQFLKHPDLRHLKIVQGWDTHLARALRDGPEHDSRHRQRCGVTSGPMSFAVHQYLEILRAAEGGNWSRVDSLQAAVTRVFRSMQDDPTRFADLQRAKYIMGLGQPLLGEVQARQAEQVLQAVAELPEDDRRRLAQSLDLMGEGPFHDRLRAWYR